MKLNLFFLKMLLFVSTIITTSCGETSKSPIPEKYVDIKISLYNAQYSALQTPGGYVYITGGNSGIWVYCYSTEEYYAYDRMCTSKIEDETPLIYDEHTHTLRHSDTTNNCNSQYNIFGIPTDGSLAKYQLKKYKTQIQSDGRLYIYNDTYSSK